MKFFYESVHCLVTHYVCETNSKIIKNLNCFFYFMEPNSSFWYFLWLRGFPPPLWALLHSCQKKMILKMVLFKISTNWEMSFSNDTMAWRVRVLMEKLLSSEKIFWMWAQFCCDIIYRQGLIWQNWLAWKYFLHQRILFRFKQFYELSLAGLSQSNKWK